MKKCDLKSGMLVELKNKKVLMVLNLMLIRADGDYYPLSYYNDDLTFCKKESEGYLDIINVSNIQNGAASTTKNWTLESITNDLLWQREEKEMIVIDGVEYELKEIKRLLNNRTEAKTEEPKETLYKCIKAVAMEDDSIKFTKNNVYRGFHEDNCRYLQNASKNTQ